MSAAMRPAPGEERRGAGDGCAPGVVTRATASRDGPAARTRCPPAQGTRIGGLVARVGLRHVVEGEVQVVPVDDAAEDRDRDRLDLGHLLQRVVHLLAGTRHRVRLQVHRTHAEDEHRAAAQREGGAVQQPSRVAVPAAHVDGAADHDGVVGLEILDGGRGPHVDVEPVPSEDLCHLVGDLVGRAVLGGVGDEGLVFHAPTVRSRGAAAIRGGCAARRGTSTRRVR